MTIRMLMVAVGAALVGSLLTTAAARPEAAQLRREQPPPRISVTAVTGSDSADKFYFVRDTQSTGCWLYLFTSLGVSLAPAPADACAVQ